MILTTGSGTSSLHFNTARQCSRPGPIVGVPGPGLYSLVAQQDCGYIKPGRFPPWSASSQPVAGIHSAGSCLVLPTAHRKVLVPSTWRSHEHLWLGHAGLRKSLLGHGHPSERPFSVDVAFLQMARQSDPTRLTSWKTPGLPRCLLLPPGRSPCHAWAAIFGKSLTGPS